MEFPSDRRVDMLPPGWSVFPSRREDRPFDSRLALCEQYVPIFSLTPSAKARQGHARRSVLANLLSLRDENWCFYSRDNNHYARLGRYSSDFYGRNWIVGVVDELAIAGLIVHERTRPSPSAGYRSRMRPTASFRTLASTIPARAVRYEPAEVIILRDDSGGLAQYADTHFTTSMRADVREQNNFLADFAIGIDQTLPVDKEGFILLDGSRVSPLRTSLHRVFNCTFGKGGRWYGPWWQNLPSTARHAILISGEGTIEEDIPCCHPRFLLAAKGRELGSDDFYGRVNRPRESVKLAVNMMLNATSMRQAIGAMCNELSPTYGFAASKQAADLLQAVDEALPELSGFWNKGVGLLLQNIDAQLCSWILQRLRRANIACLSVHDSFIVQAGHHPTLLNVMQEGLKTACNSLRKKGLPVGPVKIF